MVLRFRKQWTCSDEAFAAAEANIRCEDGSFRPGVIAKELIKNDDGKPQVPFSAFVSTILALILNDRCFQAQLIVNQYALRKATLVDENNNLMDFRVGDITASIFLEWLKQRKVVLTCDGEVADVSDLVFETRVRGVFPQAVSSAVPRSLRSGATEVRHTPSTQDDNSPVPSSSDE